MEQAFTRYIQETLEIRTQPTPWINAKGLPILLKDRYELFTLSLLGTKRLLMVAKDKTEETPAVVRKHLEMLKQYWEGEVIYVTQAISSFNRKRLIQQRVPFVIPGNQLFLPDLGMDLREHFRNLSKVQGKTFSPATQVIILDALIHGSKESMNGTQLVEKFGYSPMTINRALNELEETDVAAVLIQGRERKIEFKLAKRELWEKAQTHLRNPIKISKPDYDVKTPTNPRHVEAGLTALAHYSNLVGPKEQTYATDVDPMFLKRAREDFHPKWDSTQKNQLEVWHYDPKRFSNKRRVDPFSLYLSLRDDQDERVQTALEEMMEKIEW